MSEDPVTPTPAPDPVSPRLSFKGWLFSVWLAKNAGFVKATVTTASGLTGGLALTDLPTLKLAALVWAGVAITVATRIVVDAVQYFLTENPQ